ncbi:hypothetical protein C922_01336 [Plasmodium inui San Antonio 1]|uniref:Endonuclease/exonuclease/phosphatase domain-containing protein n=1 Tax=Plasmodium inui San Antonio 1 TaxID=1237626 RepID=W7AS57_9APIC|nr:hypothetical protein C922_01336 [Plasmodium inui San Antonio 1]EUD68316.1 hypothetical protein C922_01336 [Plasmodium inui San Antonio 1]
MDNSPKGNFLFFQKNKSNDNQLSHKCEDTMYAKGEDKKSGKRGATDSKGMTPVLKDQGVNIYINTPPSMFDKNISTGQKYDSLTGAMPGSSPMGEKIPDHMQSIFADRGVDMKKMPWMEEKAIPGGMSSYAVRNYKGSAYAVSGHGGSSNTEGSKEPPKNPQQFKPKFNKNKKNPTKEDSNMNPMSKDIKIRKSNILELNKWGDNTGDNSSSYAPRNGARDKVIPGEHQEHVQKDLSSQEELSGEGKRDNGKEKKEKAKRKNKDKNKDNKGKGKNEEREREKDKSISKGKAKEFDSKDQEEGDKKKEHLSISNQNIILNSSLNSNANSNPSTTPNSSINVMLSNALNSGLNTGPSIILNADNKNSGKNKKAKNKKGDAHQGKKNEPGQNKNNDSPQNKKNDSPQNKKNDSPLNKKNEMMKNKKMDSPQNRKNDTGQNRKNDSPNNRKNHSSLNRKNKREDFITGMNANFLLDQGDGTMIKNELLMEGSVIGKNKNMDSSMNFSEHYSYYYSNNKNDIPTMSTSRRGAFNKVHLDLYCDSNSGSYMMDSSDSKGFRYKKEPRNDMFKFGNNNFGSASGHGSDSGLVGSAGNHGGFGNHGSLDNLGGLSLSDKFHMSKSFFKSHEMGNYPFQDLSSTYDKYKTSFDPTSLCEFLDHETGKRHLHNKGLSSHGEMKNVKDNNHNVMNLKATNIIGINRTNHMHLNLSSKDNRLGITKGSDKRMASNMIHPSGSHLGKKYMSSKNLQSFNNKLNFSSEGIELGMSPKMNMFNNVGDVGGSSLGGSNAEGNNMSASNMGSHLASNNVGSNNVGSNNVGSNNVGINNLGSSHPGSSLSSNNLGSSNSVGNVLKDESHLLGRRSYNNMLSNSSMNMNPMMDGENNNLLHNSYANVTNVVSSSNGMGGSGSKVYNSGVGEGNMNESMNNVGSLNGTTFQTNKSNSSVNNRANSNKNHMNDLVSGQNYVSNVLLYDSGGDMYNGKVGRMNGYARHNVPPFSGQSLDSYANQNVDNYANQNVDNYANQNVDHYGSPNMDSYGNPNGDNYGSPHLDNYGGPHLDSYANPVMDNYVNPIMDSYANGAIDGYANARMENYTNPRMDNYDNLSVENYPSPNSDRYANRNLENYASPNGDNNYANPNLDNSYSNPNVENYTNPRLDNFVNPHMDNFVNPLMDSYMNSNIDSFANQNLDNYTGQNMGSFAAPNVDNFGPPNGDNFGSPNVDNFGPPNGDNFGSPNGDNFAPPNVDNFAPPNGDNFAPPSGGESYPHEYTNSLPMNYLNGGMTSTLSNSRGTSSINNMSQHSNELSITSANMLNSLVGKKNNLLLSSMNNPVSSSKANLGVSYINDTFKKASNLFLETAMKWTRNSSGNKVKRNKNKGSLETKGANYEMTSSSKEGNGSGMLSDRGGVNYVLEDHPPGRAKYVHNGEMAEQTNDNDAASALTNAIAIAIANANATSTNGADSSVQHMKCLEKNDTIKKKVKTEKRAHVKNIKININKINLFQNKKRKYLAEIIRCELIWGPTKNKEPITPVESCELHPVVIIKDQYGHLYDDDEDNENNPIGKTVNIFYRWSRGPPRTVCFFHPQKIACLQCTVTFRCFCSYECFMKGFDHLHKYYRSNGLINIPSHPNLHTYGVPCSPFDWDNYEKNIEFDERHYNSLVQSGLLNSPDMEKWEIINNERNYIPCLKDVGHQIMLETMLLDKNNTSSEDETTSSDECEDGSVGEDSSADDSDVGVGQVGEVGGVDELLKGQVREGSDCVLSFADEKSPRKKQHPAAYARYGSVQSSELDSITPEQVASFNNIHYAGNHKEEDHYSGQFTDGSGIISGEADRPDRNHAGTTRVFTSKGDSSTEANRKQSLYNHGTFNGDNNVCTSAAEEDNDPTKEAYTRRSALNHSANGESEGKEKRMDRLGITSMHNRDDDDALLRSDGAIRIKSGGEPTSELSIPSADTKEGLTELKANNLTTPANGCAGENVEDKKTNEGNGRGMSSSPSKSATDEVEGSAALDKLTSEREKKQIQRTEPTHSTKPSQQNTHELKKNKKKRKKKKIYILDDQVWNNIRDPNIYHKIITGCCIPNLTISPNYNVTCFNNSNATNPQNQFTIMTWNVLAEIYGTIEAFPHCDPYMLAWSYRKTKIIQEILNNSPDIVCLQEIQNEHFLDFFKPSLGEFGYEGVYKQKTKEIFTSPSGKRRGGKYTIDGCAIFYNKKKLKFVETYALEFSKLIKEASVFTLPKEIQKNPCLVKRLLKDNVALVILLEYIQQYSKIYDTKEEDGEEQKPNKNLIIVANTHIVANPEANYVKIWQTQILVKVVEYLKINFIKKYETVPSLIICGDFNSTPSSAVYQLIYKKTCSRSHEDFSSDKYSLLTDLPLGHNLNLKSAYAISKLLSQKLNPEEYTSNLEIFEPLFTNYTGNFIGCLDYIFYNDENLNIISTVNIADENQLMQEAHIYQLSNCALPSPIRPSDHLPLIAKFEFKIY